MRLCDAVSGEEARCWALLESDFALINIERYPSPGVLYCRICPRLVFDPPPSLEVRSSKSLSIHRTQNPRCQKHSGRIIHNKRCPLCLDEQNSLCLSFFLTFDRILSHSFTLTPSPLPILIHFTCCANDDNRQRSYRKNTLRKTTTK